MAQINKPKIWILNFVLMALTIGASVCRADVVQLTVVLPPVAGFYSLGGACVGGSLGRCTENAIVSNFSILSESELSGNEVVNVAATYSADIFTNNNGSPDMFVGHLTMTGTLEFVYEGRNPSVNPLGAFVTDLPMFDFQGTLGGNTFEVKQDSSMSSTGLTSIQETTFVPAVQYTVTNTLEIFADFSFNGGQFTSAPPKTVSLDSVPEPSFSVLGGAMLLGMAGIRSRRALSGSCESI